MVTYASNPLMKNDKKEGLRILRGPEWPREGRPGETTTRAEGAKNQRRTTIQGRQHLYIYNNLKIHNEGYTSKNGRKKMAKKKANSLRRAY